MLQGLCPSCNAENSIDSQSCRICGAGLGVGAQGHEQSGAADPPPVTESIKLAVCPSCHSVNEPGAAFCSSCSLPLGEKEAASASLNPDRRRSGFWIRVAAYLLDSLILAVGILALFIVVGVAVAIASPEALDEWQAQGGEATTLDTFLQLISWAGVILYYTVSVSQWAATLGKRILGLCVLRTDGSRCGIGRAFVRYCAISLSFFPLFGIPFLLVAFSEDKRGVHDHICDTVVVYKD